MITTADIKWGCYSVWEGPYWPGVVKFKTSDPPKDDEIMLAIVSSTEGSAYDAVNMYDSMRVSLGIIQAAEAHWYLSSRLLGYLAERDVSLLAPLQPALTLSGATFVKDQKSRWRFFLGGVEVTTATQCTLFFGGASGRIGGWTESTKQHARIWAAAFANTLGQEQAKQPQLDYVMSPFGIMGCLVPQAKKLLWGIPETPLVKAVQALYLSFAGNRGDLAIKALLAAGQPTWTTEWVARLARNLVYTGNVAIYPARYATVRRMIQRYYGVELPVV